MSYDLAFSIWLILMGPVAGSFMTALADRHCAGRSILWERSGCSSCGARIFVADLVPLLSWPLLRGRCRACRAPIALHVWLGEWAGLGCGVVAVWVGDTMIERGLAALFLFLLLGLFQADRLCFRLPDVLTLPLFLTGLGLGSLHAPWPQPLLSAIAGASALWLVGAFYEMRRHRVGLGFGDVKLMAGLSAAVGLAAIPWVTLVAASGALGLALVRQGRVTPDRAIPFGCYLTVAGALVWLWV